MYIILFYRKAHWYIASLTIVNVNQKFACIILWVLLNSVLHGNNYFSPHTIGNPFATSERRQLVQKVVICLPKFYLVSTYSTVFIACTVHTGWRGDTTTRHYNFNTFCISGSSTFVALHLALKRLILYSYRNGKRNHSNHAGCCNSGH